MFRITGTASTPGTMSWAADAGDDAGSSSCGGGSYLSKTLQFTVTGGTPTPPAHARPTPTPTPTPYAGPYAQADTEADAEADAEAGAHTRSDRATDAQPWIDIATRRHTCTLARQLHRSL